MHVESLLGIVRTVLEPNPTLHEKLYDVLGKAEEGYARYIVRAEKREKELRSKDNETADYLIECIGRAEDAKEEIRDLLRKVNVH